MKNEMHNNLFSKAGGKAVVCFPPSSSLFDGHFPDNPIVPGVVWLSTAISLSADIIKHPLRLQKVEQLKFFNVVLPDQEVLCTFHITPNPAFPESVCISAKWTRADDKIAEIQCTAIYLPRGKS